VNDGYHNGSSHDHRTKMRVCIETPVRQFIAFTCGDGYMVAVWMKILSFVFTGRNNFGEHIHQILHDQFSSIKSLTIGVFMNADTAGGMRVKDGCLIIADFRSVYDLLNFLRNILKGDSRIRLDADGIGDKFHNGLLYI